VPMRELAPMLVLKNSPQKSRRRPKDENLLWKLNLKIFVP
jgi:hypothetical protein